METFGDKLQATHNAAVQPPHAGLSSALQAHNAMARLLRARADVSRSAATACYAALLPIQILYDGAAINVVNHCPTFAAGIAWVRRTLERRLVPQRKLELTVN